MSERLNLPLSGPCQCRAFPPVSWFIPGWRDEPALNCPAASQSWWFCPFCKGGGGGPRREGRDWKTCTELCVCVCMSGFILSVHSKITHISSAVWMDQTQFKLFYLFLGEKKKHYESGGPPLSIKNLSDEHGSFCGVTGFMSPRPLQGITTNHTLSMWSLSSLIWTK